VSSETEGVDQTARQAAAKICARYGATLLYHSPPARLGGNINHLLEKTKAPYFLYMQEDWLLDCELDVPVHLRLLEANDNLGMLRYRWVDEKNMNFGEQLTDEFRWITPKSMWYYAHNPYLAKRRVMEQLYPFFALTNGGNENKMNRKAKKLVLGVAVRQPSCFLHVGEHSVITPKKKRPVEHRFKDDETW